MVLIVEEVEGARHEYSGELTAAGFMVLEASDGDGALEKVTRFAPQAVVVDVGPPGDHGLEVARRLREERAADIVILAVADRPAAEPEDPAIAAGCDALMSKPILGAALVGEIVRLLAAKRAAADLQAGISAPVSTPLPTPPFSAARPPASRR
jgi:two-component system response regulator/two-component system chemotaxis response regulator CheY